MATSPETKPRSVQFKIGVEGAPDTPVHATLYAFDVQGALLASGPLRDDLAQLAIPPLRLQRARLFVGPTLPEGRSAAPTLQSMARLNAYEPAWRFERGRQEYELLPIPALLWPHWRWCSCRVRGLVLKVETRDGVTSERRVCHARVHICEVDRLPWILGRLPDRIILRLRDELLVAIDRPFPPNPNPPDPPFSLSRVVDSKALLARAASVFGKLDAVAFNPQPDPPGLTRQPGTAGLALELRSALASESPQLVRDALIGSVSLLRPFWCRWGWLEPYLRPYLYDLEELAVVETGENGRFDATVLYRCDDQPDLYFWVEVPIGGIWETVSRPPVRCNTYWDYTCGREVTLRLTDPRVQGCGERPEVLGKKVVVKTIGREVSMGEIYRDSPDPALHAKEGQVKEGWLDVVKPSPFGGRLEPRVDFGSGLNAAGITHYRWSYRPLGSTADSDWKAIDQPVLRHYRVSTPPGAPATYHSLQIGPDTAFSGPYTIIAPALPANGEDWEVLDESFDLASAYFDTPVAPGKYELKLELFKSVGGILERVDLTAEGVELYEITAPAPLVEGSYTTTAAAGDRTLIETGTGHVVGYRLVLHVDNRECFGTINDVTLGGALAGPCGFLEYDAAEEEALISFRASHPDNFATFSFRLVRVATPVAEGAADGRVDDLDDNGFSRAGDTFSKPLSVDTLMHSGLDAGATPCTRAAFAESLHVSALATDGYARLSSLDAPRPASEDPTQVGLRAFAITPA
jgi:hypothetical protein